jgi:hypothetical protein
MDIYPAVASATSPNRVPAHLNRALAFRVARFTKLDLSGEQQVNRRVAAVLTFPSDANLRPPG